MSEPNSPRQYSRKLSPIERLWIVADTLYPPFVSQLVLEGEGGFDLPAWQQAAKRASAANPGSRLVLRRFLGWSRWVDSEVPIEVHLIDGGDWDGKGPENAPFLKRPLPARSGPTCEILLLQGNPNRVVLRAHHGVTDGIGGLGLIDDLFRELRGKASRGTEGSQVDIDIVRQLGTKKIKVVKNNCQSPLPPATKDKPGTGTTWRRITIPGRHSNLLGKIAFAIAQRAHELKRQTLAMTGDIDADQSNARVVRLDIAADMRHHSPESSASSANLTGMITIEVSETDTVANIISAMAAQRRAKREGMLVAALGPLRWVPLRLLKQYWHYRTRRAYKSGCFATSASLSNIGLLPVARYRGGGFKAKTAFAVPPGNAGIPLLIIFNDTGQQVELVAMVPDSAASVQQLESLLEDIKNTLLKDSTGIKN